MPLDVLFGAGTTAMFAAHSTGLEGMEAPVISGITDKSGRAAIDMVWHVKGVTAASCHIDFTKHRAHYGNLLVAKAYRGKGMYQKLILQHPKLFRELGILVLTAWPEGPRSEYLLMLGGFHWQEWEGSEWFAARTANDRMESYAEWLEEGSPEATEPLYHRVLREHVVAGEEEY